MRDSNEKVAHAAREITINKVRSQGYYINCKSAVKPMLSKYVHCRQFVGKVCQKIS